MTLRPDSPIEHFARPLIPSSSITPLNSARMVSNAINRSRSDKLLKVVDNKLARHNQSIVRADAMKVLENEQTMCAEIRDATSMFYRRNKFWVQYLEEEVIERLIKIIELRCRGLCTTAEYLGAINDIKSLVIRADDDRNRWSKVSFSDGGPLCGGW